MDSQLIKQKLNIHDILNWKSPALTVTFLLIVDIAYIIFRSMQTSVISSIAQKVFFLSLVMMAKNFICGKKSESCGCLEKENIEKTYVAMFDSVNKALDKLRRIILLKEIPSLIRLLISLFFFITFGSYFSTLSLLIICLNLYILSNFGSMRDTLRSYSNAAYDITSRIVYDNLPKYKED